MEQTLKHVLEALRSTEELLKSVLEDKELSREKLTTVEVKLENVEKDLDSLLHIIRGNGTEGLQIKTRLIEEKIQALEEKLDKRHEEVVRLKLENTKGKWGMYAAIVSGILGFVTAVGVALVGVL